MTLLWPMGNILAWKPVVSSLIATSAQWNDAFPLVCSIRTQAGERMIPRGEEKVKTMGYSEAQILGFVEKVESLLMAERATLMEANLDVDSMRRELLELNRIANESNEKQERKKRELKASTEEHKVDIKKLYVAASSDLDMMIGGVEKNSIPAANFRRIRSRLKRPYSDEDEEASQAPQPVPQPVPVK